ncbi:hypothetical protein CEP49_00510 [Mergibacter septicus]|uniref:Trm112 family protein n=1 Tax=Mergibacter septicus TaxID=221402 RepID=UPI0011795F01|nr:Trm112 family protein [Mergibacter septicus]AWX13132.1 hypothetical protein CEP49_00510 [Mergibacter septicus]
MTPEIIKLLACPQCQQALTLDQAKKHLICQAQQVSYPIINGIPALLPEMAQPLITPTTSE